jgi:hypothetical protein
MDESVKSHDHLKGLGLDSQLEIIKDGGHVLREIDGKPFMKLMERMRDGSVEDRTGLLEGTKHSR